MKDIDFIRKLCKISGNSVMKLTLYPLSTVTYRTGNFKKKFGQNCLGEKGRNFGGLTSFVYLRVQGYEPGFATACCSTWNEIQHSLVNFPSRMPGKSKFINSVINIIP